MKKVILLLLLLNNLQAFSQQEIIFRTEYKPELVYNQFAETTSTTTTTYLGPADYLEKRKKEGKDNPKIKTNKLVLKSTHKTGKLNNGAFPLTIKYEGTGKPWLKNGATIYGDVKQGTLPRFFSVNAPNMDDKAKVELLQDIKVQIQYHLFSEHKVKVGESFVEEKPEEIDAAPYKFFLRNTFKFTLIKIEGNKAFFDIDHDFTFTTNDPELQKNKTSGHGKGNAVYDIENHFLLLYEMTQVTNMELLDESPSKKVLREDLMRISSEIVKE